MAVEIACISIKGNPPYIHGSIRGSTFKVYIQEKQSFFLWDPRARERDGHATLDFHATTNGFGIAFKTFVSDSVSRRTQGQGSGTVSGFVLVTLFIYWV